MEVTLATEKEKKLWDEIVTGSDQGTIFHTWDFLSIMERHSVKKVLTREVRSILYPLLISDKYGVAGIAPVFYYAVPGWSIAASPPFAVENYYLGPVFNSLGDCGIKKREIRELEFHRTIDQYLKENIKPKMILFHTAPGLHDTRQFKWNGYEVEPRYTYCLDLKKDFESIQKSFSKSLRHSIRKAEKSGIIIEEGGRDEITVIYDKLQERNRIFAPPAYLNDICSRFSPKNIRVFIAKKDDSVLSGIITTIWKDKVSFWVGSPRYSIDGVNPNVFVFNESIRWACENRYSRYEIIGADNRTLFAFKQKFNADLVLYYNLRWLSPISRFSRNVFQIFKSPE
jgi:hypothetical protein